MKDFVEIKYSRIKDTYKHLCSSSDIIFSYVSLRGKKKFFKSSGRFSNADNEIIADALFSALGLPHVRHKKAKYIDKRGNIIPGIVSDEYKKFAPEVEVLGLNKIHEKLYDYLEEAITLHSIKESITKFLARDKNGVLGTLRGKKVVFSDGFDMFYKKLSLVLYLAAQRDPYAKNFEFIVRRQGRRFFVANAPFYDNSITFFRTIEYMNQPEKADKKEKLDFLKTYKPVLGINKTYFTDMNRRAYYKDVHEEIKSNKQFKQFVDKIMNLDLGKAIDDYVGKTTQTNVSEKSKKHAVECFAQTRKLLNEGLQTLKTFDESKLNLNVDLTKERKDKGRGK